MNENNFTEDIPEVSAELTVGEILRMARTTGRRKREITTIAKQLCIREEFLTALEQGDYAAIPETVYILGFARNYAMELGLNPDEIVAKIKREMGLVSDCAATDDAAQVTDGASCKVADGVNMSVMLKSAWAFVKRHWMWFAGGLAVVAIAVVALVFAFAGNDEVAVPVDSVPVIAPVEDGEPEYKMTVRERFGTDNRKDASVILQATSESWVKVEDARGKTVFSRVLVPGDVYYVPTDGRHRATFGNAGGIDVWVDGALAPAVGADHKRVADVVLTAEALLGKK